MHLSFYGKQYDIPAQVKQYAEQKLSVIEKFLPDVQEIRVNISLGHHHRKGEVFTVSVHLTRARERMNARAESQDPYAGLDFIVEKLERQIAHERGKRRTVRLRFRRYLSPRNMFAVSRKNLSRLRGSSRRLFGKTFRWRRSERKGEREEFDA